MAAAAFFHAAKMADAVAKVSPLLGNIFRYLATMVTGADDGVVTGTAGTSGNVAMWNVDGDVVDGSVAASSLTTEALQDLVGAMTTGNTETGITVTYQDADGTIDFELADEYIQDVVGAMVTGNTETLITVTYQDADGTIDFEITDAELTSIAGLTLAQGDIIYASAAATFAKLAKNASATRYLGNTGASNNPAWAQIDLSNGVTGVLPTANGGTSVNIASAALPLGSGQIAFPATQSASADANTLDDYEEGTWTPTLQDDSLSNSESQAYSVQIGRYVKIGLVVYFWGRLTTSSIGTLTGSQNARIAGLPFSSENTTDLFGQFHANSANGLAMAAVNACSGGVAVNGTYCFLRQWSATTGTSILTVTEWSADGDMSFNGSYRAAA